MRKFFKVALSILSLMFAFSAFAEGEIKVITIKGNQRIEQSTIREYLGLQAGDHFSGTVQSEAVKKLYATSMFESVSIDFHDGNLIVSVKETPFVSKIVFKGNSKVKMANLAKEISTSPGESLKKSRIKMDVEKIKEIYKRMGRFSVIVTSKIEEQANNRVKVIFEITEGPKTGIKDIRFVGNNSYSDSELRSIILTKESRWFRFLESNDTYDPERIEHDKYLLKEFYNSVGFADFRVISVTASLLPTKEGFSLVYSIEEGEKYQFGDVSFDNQIKEIDNKDIEKFLVYKKGQTFNLKSMRRVSEKISDYLSGRGYPQIDVYPDLVLKENERIVDVKIVIAPGDKVFINKINIDGNLKTEDRVIRRQFKIAEGDIFNRSKIEKGEQNLRNLDYFDKLQVRLSPTEKRDRYDINIDLEEKSTSSISLDLGYNTSGGPFGRISFLERNLVGTGKYLSAGVQMGKHSTSYNASLVDPSFLDRDLSLGNKVFYSSNGRGSGFTSGEQKYAIKSMGYSPSIGYEIVEDLSHEIDYLIKKDTLTTPDKSSSIFIKEQMGKYTTSSISHSLTYDQTDSKIIPKNGYLVSGTQEFAGLGGNTKFLKHELEGKIFKSFMDNKVTLKFSANGGHIKGVSGKKVRISDRFNVGDYNLRGFASGGIGPRVILDKSKGTGGEGLGGQKYYTASAELNFPIGLPEEFNVTGALFYDIGALWDADTMKANDQGFEFYNSKSIRSAAGFGILWVTKIAPIRMDWGFAINKQKYDETQLFHLRFSTHF